MSRLKVGDYLAMFADEESRAQDRDHGYTLPFNIAEISALDLKDGTVDIIWMFATSTDGVFSRWVVENGPTLEEKNKSISEFVQHEIGGNVIKIKLTTTGKLDKASKESLKEWVDADEWVKSFTNDVRQARRAKRKRKRQQTSDEDEEWWSRMK